MPWNERTSELERERQRHKEHKQALVFFLPGPARFSTLNCSMRPYISNILCTASHYVRHFFPVDHVTHQQQQLNLNRVKEQFYTIEFLKL